MHWLTLVTFLAWIVAWLVLIYAKGWTLLNASLLLIGCAVCFVVVVMLLALLFNREHFGEFRTAVITTIKRDWMDVYNALLFRSRK